MLKRCITFISVLAVLGAVAFRAEYTPASAQAPGSAQAGGQGRGGGGTSGPIPSIEDRTNGMRKIDGYFPLYWDDRAGSMFLEIPKLDTEFLMAFGLAAGLGSNDIGLDRGQGGGGRVVFFQRVGPRIMLVQPGRRRRRPSCGPATASSTGGRRRS